MSSANTIGFSAKGDASAANTVPYIFTITNNPSSADLFQLNVGVTNRFKVRNDGRIMTSAAYIYFNNSTGDWLNINTAGNLSISGNVMYFGNTSEYIQLSDASNWFRIVQDAVETHRFLSNGDIAIAGKRIVFDIIGGNEWIDISDSTQQFRIGLNGVVEMTLGSTGFLVPNAYSSTTTSAANAVFQSDGRFRRSTSLSAHKQDIRPWKPEESVLDLTPVTFYPMEGNPTTGEKMKRVGRSKLLGLTYEDTAANFPKGVSGDDAIDWNAIAVGILEEVKKLRQEVDELKVA